MASLEPEHMPGKVMAEGGFVLLDGPGGVAIAMTAEAARETGRRMIAAADDAVRQTTGPATR